MRPGPVGWAMLLFLGVIAATDEGAAAEAADAGETALRASGGTRSPGTGRTPEARARWVLDRIEEEVAVIVGAGGARAVPRAALGAGAREGDLLDDRLVPAPAATARARAGVARARRQLVEATADAAAGVREDAALRAPADPGSPPIEARGGAHRRGPADAQTSSRAPAPPVGPAGPRASR